MIDAHFEKTSIAHWELKNFVTPKEFWANNQEWVIGCV